jgi:hypothetical protein
VEEVRHHNAPGDSLCDRGREQALKMDYIHAVRTEGEL